MPICTYIHLFTSWLHSHRQHPIFVNLVCQCIVDYTTRQTITQETNNPHNDISTL